MVNYAIIDDKDGKEHSLKSDDNDEMFEEASRILNRKYHEYEKFTATYKIKDVDTGEITGNGAAVVRGIFNLD